MSVRCKVLEGIFLLTHFGATYSGPLVQQLNHTENNGPQLDYASVKIRAFFHCAPIIEHHYLYSGQQIKALQLRRSPLDSKYALPFHHQACPGLHFHCLDAQQGVQGILRSNTYCSSRISSQCEPLCNYLQEISLSDYRGKWVVFFWYPLDFTFVCPTEIIAFGDRADEFAAINTQVRCKFTASTGAHHATIVLIIVFTKLYFN
jgi:hypothetical protein